MCPPGRGAVRAKDPPLVGSRRRRAALGAARRRAAARVARAAVGGGRRASGTGRAELHQIIIQEPMVESRQQFIHFYQKHETETTNPVLRGTEICFFTVFAHE